MRPRRLLDLYMRNYLHIEPSGFHRVLSCISMSIRRFSSAISLCTSPLGFVLGLVRGARGARHDRRIIDGARGVGSATRRSAVRRNGTFNLSRRMHLNFRRFNVLYVLHKLSGVGTPAERRQDGVRSFNFTQIRSLDPPAFIRRFTCML